ncbi:MAG: antitoxin [Rubrivivax sp.]|nr:antitoxin [Rubrivivax sp.]
MRTTVTLDPDVELLVKNAVRERDASFKQVLNDGLRRGLSTGPHRAATPFVQLTFDAGRPLVDLTKAGALADEVEDREIMAKLLQAR